MWHERQHGLPHYSGWSGWLLNARRFLSYLQESMRIYHAGCRAWQSPTIFFRRRGTSLRLPLSRAAAHLWTRTARSRLTTGTPWSNAS